MTPYGKHEIDQDDINAVIDVLQSNFLTQGPKVSEFEKALTIYTQAKHAIAVNSATSALHIACLALGVSNNDIVWTCANTFVASANCAEMCGAQIEFIDINKQTGNICLKKLAVKLEQAKHHQRLPSVIIPVHFSGNPCNMQELSKLAEQYNFKIIEDASHALGSDYDHKKTGSCEYSDITVFSFHPVKMITTGEGGAALTNQSDLMQKMRAFSCHGITQDIRNNNGPTFYTQHVLGYNYRMSDIHAALGISQLKKLDKWVKKRREIAAHYHNNLSNNVIIQTYYEHSSYHLYTIHFDSIRTRNTAYNTLKEQGILTQIHYIPVNTQPYYQNQNKQMQKNDCPNALEHFNTTLSLPIYSTLTLQEQNRIINILNTIEKSV